MQELFKNIERQQTTDPTNYRSLENPKQNKNIEKHTQAHDGQTVDNQR